MGRLTLGDALELDEALADGGVQPPFYVPPWARDIRALAAFLSLSDVLHQIEIADLTLADIAI